MHNTLTFAILHYGNTDTLDRTIKNASQYGKVMVTRLDLFDDNYGDAVIPWDFLINKGYSDAWNLLVNLTDTEFVYILGAGKQIDNINEENFDPKFDQFACVHPTSSHTWYKCGRRNQKWAGKIHEELTQYNGVMIQTKPTFTWSRFDQEKRKLDEKDKIAKVYRWFSRVKWLYDIQVLGINREGTNRGWWTFPELQVPNKSFDLFLENKYILESKDLFLDKSLDLFDKL